MCYTITLIILKCILIYLSSNPHKFSKVTNSGILNYGIWIQTEVSLVISLWFLLRSLTKITNKWTFTEKLSEIDKIMENEFSINLCYNECKLYGINSTNEKLKRNDFLNWIFRWSLLSASSGVVAAFILFGLTIYFLIDIPFDPLHKACVCFSIYMSNVCIYVITVEFICYVYFLFMRFHCINNVLRQLLFDDSYLHHSIIDESASKELIYTNYVPIDHKKCFLNTKSKMSSIHMSEWMERRRNDYANQRKPPTKFRFTSVWRLYTKTYEYFGITWQY